MNIAAATALRGTDSLHARLELLRESFPAEPVVRETDRRLRRAIVVRMLVVPEAALAGDEPVVEAVREHARSLGTR